MTHRLPEMCTCTALQHLVSLLHNEVAMAALETAARNAEEAAKPKSDPVPAPAEGGAPVPPAHLSAKQV